MFQDKVIKEKFSIIDIKQIKERFKQPKWNNIRKIITEKGIIPSSGIISTSLSLLFPGKVIIVIIYLSLI
jgi:hypothetical protein